MVGGAPRALFHEDFLPQAACHYEHLPAVKAWLRAPRGVALRRCDAQRAESLRDSADERGRDAPATPYRLTPNQVPRSSRADGNSTR